MRDLASGLLFLLSGAVATCHACMPHSSGVPELAPPGNYPMVTGMEIRALGTLMGGILETKAYNMVTTGFVTGPLLTYEGRSFTHLEAKHDNPEFAHLFLRSPPITRRLSFAALQDHCALSNIEHPASMARGLKMRGGHPGGGGVGHAMPSTGREGLSVRGGETPKPSTSLQSSASNSADNQLARTNKVDSEPLYPPITEKDKLWAVFVGSVAASFKLALSETLAGKLIGASISFFAAASLCAFFRRDHRMRASLVSEEEARYPGSQFVDAGAVRAHFLEALPADGSPPQRSLLLVHGFGASARSYHAAMQPLADAAQARVLAVDMPGFGLTSRPSTLHHYDAAAMLTSLSSALNLKKDGPLIVVGHSLGGLAAARYLLSTPSPPAAVVLVAPAIIAAGQGQRKEETGETAGARTRSGAALAAGAGAGAGAEAAARAEGVKGEVGGGLRWVGAVLGVMVRLSAATATVALVWFMKLLTPVLALVLRLAVYTKAFWSAGLTAAYHDKEKLSETTVEGYRRGSWVRGWEAGVLNFVWFRATAGKSPWSMVKEAVGERKGGGLVGRLEDNAVPLLLIHGEQDRIIPAANSRNLAQITGCEFVGIDACGHCPMEETPGQFTTIIADFVKKIS